MRFILIDERKDRFAWAPCRTNIHTLRRPLPIAFVPVLGAFLQHYESDHNIAATIIPYPITPIIHTRLLRYLIPAM